MRPEGAVSKVIGKQVARVSGHSNVYLPPPEELSAMWEVGNPVPAWPVPEQLLQSPAVEYRNRLARELARLPAAEICSRYCYLLPPQMEVLVKQAIAALKLSWPRGMGIELGAGCGLLSCVLARSCEVRSILALEVCEVMARSVIPIVAASVLGRDHLKVVPVFGSFDCLHLPDCSLDFAAEIDSLHHSENLQATLSECRRVLKPGALLICFDRSHPDTLTDSAIEEMLERVYSPDFLRANCYPENVKLTRRQNGEHEYRLGEWLNAFTRSGFTGVRYASFAKRIPVKHVIKAILGLLPPSLRRSLRAGKPTARGVIKEWIKQTLRTEGKTVLMAPKETTAFAAFRA